MSVFSKMSDIINSNINQVLEQAEDPEKLLKLATQEMEDALVAIRSAIIQQLGDKKVLNQKQQDYLQSSSTWTSKTELAISRGRDDLAKAALREKIRFESALNEIEGELIQADITIDKLKADSVRLQTKLQAAKARQKLLSLRAQTARARIKVKKQLHNVSLDDAFSKFTTYERKLDEMEGEIESFELGSQSLSSKINELQKDADLTIALETIKRKMGRIETTQAAATQL